MDLAIYKCHWVPYFLKIFTEVFIQTFENLATRIQWRSNSDEGCGLAPLALRIYVLYFIQLTKFVIKRIKNTNP